MSKGRDLPTHLETRDITGEKLISPSASRNIGPLVKELSSLWSPDAKILEIASGTGQHGHGFCEERSDLIWQYSDIDEKAMLSQVAWASEIPEQLLPPIELDVLAPNWWRDIKGYQAIFCANMIHIAPLATVNGLALGASHILPNGEPLFLYGPFLDGENSAQSNLDFDISLKLRHADWGVRNLANVKHIFATHGLSLHDRVQMPRDNYLLVFEKTD